MNCPLTGTILFGGGNLTLLYGLILVLWVVVLPVPIVAFSYVSRIIRNLKPDRYAFRTRYLSKDEVGEIRSELSSVITTQLLALISCVPMFFSLIAALIYSQNVAVSLIAVVLSWLLMPVFVSQVSLLVSISSRNGRLQPSYPKFHQFVIVLSAFTIAAFDILVVVALALDTQLSDGLSAGVWVCGAVGVYSFEAFIFRRLFNHFWGLRKSSASSETTIVWQFEPLESLSSPSNSSLPSMTELDAYIDV